MVLIIGFLDEKWEIYWNELREIDFLKNVELEFKICEIWKNKMFFW